MSDSNGYIYDEGGIDNKELTCIMHHKNVKRTRIKECSKEFKCRYVENQRPWDIKCDIAFPSATQNEINGEDAKTLVKNGCIAVGEGANMPTTPEGVRVFQKAKLLYAPGKAANAGGVATSGLEMSQNSMRLSWSREEVDRKLHDIMIAIHEQCVKYGKEGGSINYVNGANVAGFVKVADAMLAQGLV
jgi:glutamate dehydrogenase (NADP+)